MGKHGELLGRKIGKLLVVERLETKKGNNYFYRCLCDCGNTIDLASHRLSSKRSNKASCGCDGKWHHKTYNLVGNRYDKLLVVELTDQRNSLGAVKYRCICDCGKEVFLSSNSLNLKRGTKSCGCTRKDNIHKLPPGESSAKGRYNRYKCGAKHIGLVFCLSYEEFLQITSLNCYYCGCSPSNVHREGLRCNGSFTYTGIDRVDSSIGYIKENCVPCCGICNSAKSDRPQQEFLDWVDRVHEMNVRGRK